MNLVRFFPSTFANLLAWATLLTIPLAIVLLYFLKLKRQPLEVPSTYLWTRTIEDLHVNTIWQRLRQSLLLFLQLLLIVLAVLACLQPGWRDSRLDGNRFIFLIDASASMSASDLKPSRLDKAKELALQHIEQMKSGDKGMVISFSDVATIEQEFTDERGRLRTGVARVKQTSRPTDLSEALRAAAGLANPGRTGSDPGDVQVAAAKPAQLFIFSDGGFPSVKNFSTLHLNLEYVPLGDPHPENVAVTAFTTERNPDKPTEVQAFAQFQNFGQQDVQLEPELYLNGELIDAASVELPAGESNGVTFKIAGRDDGLLKVDTRLEDFLQIDNVGYTALNPARLAKVLVVTPGNDALQLALDTEQVQKLATVTFAEPAILTEPAYQEPAESGVYDLIVFDRCAPPAMPQANTLFIGRTPPGKDWSLVKPEVDRAPVIIDTDKVHPLMQLVEMGNVVVVEGSEVKGPQGSVELMSASIGALVAIAPRQGFEDTVLGFEIYSTSPSGSQVANTNWFQRSSFPVFALNAVRYLGGAQLAHATPSHKPGAPVVVRTEGTVTDITIAAPDEVRTSVKREGQAAFVFNDTEQQGIYNVFEGRAERATQQFAVNLFDDRESNLIPAPKLEIDSTEVTGVAASSPIRRELWKLVLVAALGVLVFEWYVYNRRVYL